MRRIIFSIFIFCLACSYLTAQTNDKAIPPKRAHHQLVYDEANKVILMTAGSSPVDCGKPFNVFNDM